MHRGLRPLTSEEQKIVVQYHYLVLKLAKLIWKNPIIRARVQFFDDMIQWGEIGLIWAVEHFIPRWNPQWFAQEDKVEAKRFMTYSYSCIRLHILREVNKFQFIHIPDYAKAGYPLVGIMSFDPNRDARRDVVKESYEEERAAILKAMQLLPPKEQTIIILRFFNDPPATLEEIGKQCGGLSKERIRQIIDTALKVLRKELGSQQLFQI